MKKFIVRSEGSAAYGLGGFEALLRSLPIPYSHVSEVMPKPYNVTRYFSVPNNPVCNVEDLPLILKVADIARVTGLSKQTCYRLCQSDDFPAFKPNGSVIYLIPRDKFFEWLDNQVEKTSYKIV